MMQVNVIDVTSKKRIKIQSPALELFERSTPDGSATILRLDLLEQWIREVNKKNPEFGMLTILKGVACAYYTGGESKQDLLICWKNRAVNIPRTNDVLLAVEKIEQAVVKLVRFN